MTELCKMHKPELLLGEKTINGYWVYAVYDVFNRLLFLNYGKLDDIVHNRPIRALSCFDIKELYKIYLLEICATEWDAKNSLNWWIDNSELKGALPPWNYIYKKYNNDKFIRCVTNGELFINANEIVKTYGVSQSALSCHLRKIKGYKTVKGMQFEYCDQSIGYEQYNSQKQKREDGPLPQQGDIVHTAPKPLTPEQVDAIIGDYGKEVPMTYQEHLAAMEREKEETKRIAAKIQADYERYCLEHPED